MDIIEMKTYGESIGKEECRGENVWEDYRKGKV